MFYKFAAVYNWIAGAAFLIAPAFLFPLMGDAGSPDPFALLSVRLFGLLVVMFGVGYYWIGQNPKENLPILKLGMIAKALVFVLIAGTFIIYPQIWLLALAGAGDLIFAIFFARDLRKLSRA